MEEDWEVKTRVGRGMKLLDSELPTWRADILLDKLDMHECDRCVLGQLFGTFDDGVDSLGLDPAEVVDHGFDVDDDRYPPRLAPGYKLLREEWRRAIEREGV